MGFLRPRAPPERQGIVTTSPAEMDHDRQWTAHGAKLLSMGNHASREKRWPRPSARDEPRAEASTLYHATPPERISLLSSTAGGLSAEEAGRRLTVHGPNEPAAARTPHPLRQFAAQFTHTLALLLWFAAGLAFAARIPELGGAIVAVVVVNGVFAFVQEYRAEQVMASLMKRVAVQATVVRDGRAARLATAELVPGDVVRLVAGDVVPADCLLLESDNLTLDLSMLTGETLPVARSPEPLPTGPPAQSDAASVACLAPAGAGVSTGSGTAVVWRTGAESSVGQIADLVTGVRRRPSLLERQVAALSHVTAVIAVLAGTATLTLASVTTETSFVSALTFGTGVIVALVPEGLLPTLSVSLAIGARRMAERGAAVRRLAAVEVVGSVTVICSDKTGTLTENRLSVEGVTASDGSREEIDRIQLTAAIVNEACEDGAGSHSGDPFDVALWRWLSEEGFDASAAREVHPRLSDIAFDARSRYASVTCQTPDGRRVFVKGAPEAVQALAGCPTLTPPMASAVQSATGRGHRVLSLASGPEGGPLTIHGVVQFADQPRDGVPAAVDTAEGAGLRILMLTGDHPGTAAAVAVRIGLGRTEIPTLEGRDVDLLSDDALRIVLAGNAVVARVNPEQKLRIIRVLQAIGEVVVMTGDGVNDAPGLRAADVGVAMGRRGTEVAKQASDIVLSDDNFTTIVAAIEEGRAIRANIRRFISYVFTSNVAEMTPFLVYLFLPVPLPLAVIQALAVSIGTDLLPALALGAESPAPAIMSQPPEPPSRPLLTLRLALLTFLFFGVIEACLGLAGFFAFYVAHGWRLGDSFAPYSSVARQATTITFLSIVGGQVGCLFAQRDGRLLQRLSLRTNRWVPAGLAFELVLSLILVFVPGLNGLFSMAAIPGQWLLVIPGAFVVFTAMDQGRRLVSR